MTIEFLRSLPDARRKGGNLGITSVCSAHPEVIRATLENGKGQDGPVLIEATCNQVNQDGGYTGMTPKDFRHYVEGIARKVGFDMSKLILGGDHLGPNPWKALPAEEALDKAKVMIAAYAEAGFEKLHLDCSMGCAGEPIALADELVAERAASLAAVAEQVAPGAPVYIIGTEVPVPGGALEEVENLQVTSPAAAGITVSVHEAAFRNRNLESAFERVVGLVVQPGVEFGHHNVVAYDPPAAAELSKSLDLLPHIVFEAHSTDYQSEAALSALVRDGFAILKVGPGLTFALREALYGLDLIAAELDGAGPTLRPAMEALMAREPGYWASYYHGTPDEQRIARHFSYSDRIRYYWNHPEAQAAVDALLVRLGNRKLPEPLIGQYLGAAWGEVMTGLTAATAPSLQRAAITRVLRSYGAAVGQGRR